MKIDYTLYLVTDRTLLRTPQLTDVVEQALLGGCTMVQLREKNISSLDFFALATKIKSVTDRFEIPLIINDRIDIALSVHAAGVHIGQKDLPAHIARQIIGKNLLLGVSASSVQEAVQAQSDGADYLGVGAMFPTNTKNDANMVSLTELQHIRESVTIPIVAIGGINEKNAAQFHGIGINGIAVISAIIAQPDVQQAAFSLKQLFKGETVQ